MKRLRMAGSAVLVLVLAGGLAGCEITGQYAATCTTAPPVPHHNAGVVEVDIEIPPEVDPGSTFTVRVDRMTGYALPGSSGSFPTGVLSITGPVTPSGQFSVGQGVFGGSPYPNTLELTVTGHPGDEIRIGAVRGGSVLGQLPDAVLVTCFADDAEIVTIPVVPAEAPSPAR